MFDQDIKLIFSLPWLWVQRGICAVFCVATIIRNHRKVNTSKCIWNNRFSEPFYWKRSATKQHFL